MQDPGHCLQGGGTGVCPRLLLDTAPGSLPRALPPTRLPQRRHSTIARRAPPPRFSATATGGGRFEPLPPSPRCALRATSQRSDCDSEHGPPPGMKQRGHELDLSLQRPRERPSTLTLTLSKPNPPPSPRRALRVTPQRSGCDSEHDPATCRARIKQRDHKLDFDHPIPEEPGPGTTWLFWGSVVELARVKDSSRTEGCPRRSLASPLR